MDFRWKLLGGALIWLAFILFIRWSDKHDTLTVPINKDVTVRATPSRIIITSKTDRLSVPNYGHGIDVVQHGGTVTYKPITHGKSLQPGFSTDFQRVGLSIEIAFFKRLSLLAGSNFFNLRTQQWDVRFHGGVAYRLPWSYVDNLSFYSGIDSGKHITCGMFVRFGGN